MEWLSFYTFRYSHSSEQAYHELKALKLPLQPQLFLSSPLTEGNTSSCYSSDFLAGEPLLFGPWWGNYVSLRHAADSHNAVVFHPSDLPRSRTSARIQFEALRCHGRHKMATNWGKHWEGEKSDGLFQIFELFGADFNQKQTMACCPSLNLQMG